uniref:CAAX prenyl protease 2/Lysostaphin resistance protein A-like domain-containing protein n=1 Tax=uncultured Thiotrichaceae bacterium TaxID=298394 RepID=A0A6S6THE8_9GAMM|nr:MAG: Unknown protein [uncultured Thiotrichaceae bacterium]
MKNNPLDETRSTLVISILFGVMFFLPLFLYTTFPAFGPNAELSAGAAFTLDNLVWLTSYPIIAALLWLATANYKDELADIVLNIPDPIEVRSYIILSIGMIISAIGCTYLLFYPLSLIAPDFVQSWLLETPHLLYWDDGGLYLIGNIAGVIMAIVFAPILEEFLFRGYLLNRWTLRLGAIPAILLSSLLFAILHPDVLGAFIFAVMMALLYMKTRSLVAPIVLHAANNTFAVILEWVDRSMFSGFEPVTITDFQDYLWLGIICMMIGFPWLWFYAKQHFFPLKPLLIAHEKGETNNYLA